MGSVAAAMKAMKAKSVAAAPKAMKAMKAKSVSSVKAKGGALTATAAYQQVGEAVALKTKDAKAAMEGIMEVAVSELSKHGSFKLAGFLNLKLKKKAARAAKKGINPFTKEPCVFKARPASKTVKGFAMKKLKEAIN